MTTRQGDRRRSAAFTVMVSADLAAGRREPTVPAAGEAWTPAGLAASPADSVGSTEEGSMDGAKATRTIAVFGGRHMLKLLRDRSVQIVSIGLVLSLVTLIIGTACCPRGEAMAASRDATKTFASPQEAGDALFKGAQSGDPAALLQIFGPDGKDVLLSGDPATDRTALKDFVGAYETMHRWGRIDAGGQMLYVGADNFPFPIPLEKNASGQWYFDSGEGADEILARRIG